MAVEYSGRRVVGQVRHHRRLCRCVHDKQRDDGRRGVVSEQNEVAPVSLMRGESPPDAIREIITGTRASVLIARQRSFVANDPEEMPVDLGR